MATATVLGGIETLSLRYRDEEWAWRARWDPTDITDMPRAVEPVADLAHATAIRQLFLVGTGPPCCGLRALSASAPRVCSPSFCLCPCWGLWPPRAWRTA